MHIEMMVQILAPKFGVLQTCNLENCRSISMDFLSLGFGSISWSSKKQDAIALSSLKEKYMVVTTVGCKLSG